MKRSPKGVTRYSTLGGQFLEDLLLQNAELQILAQALVEHLGG